METHPGMSPADHETTHRQQPPQRNRGWRSQNNRREEPAKHPGSGKQGSRGVGTGLQERRSNVTRAAPVLQTAPETLAWRPAGGPRGLCTLLPPDCLLPKTNDEQKASNSPAPTQNVLGPTEAFHRWGHTPSTAREADFLHPEYKPSEGPAGWLGVTAAVRWKHHLIGSWHPQKAPLSCLGPTRSPETPRQRFCLRGEACPGACG